jgi:hypothetical protein
MRTCVWLLFLALLLCGCASRPEPENVPSPTASLTAVIPDVVIAGKPFFANAKGLSTLGVRGANLTPNCRIRIGSQMLETEVLKDGTSATAPVPDSLYATPGKFDVAIQQPDGGLSNVVVFTVLAPTGPAPVIEVVAPSGTIAGQDFNVQPGGRSAVGIGGSNFMPGAKVLFGQTELETVFGGVNGCSAWVPPALYAKPGTIEVRIRNSDGKLSQPRPFLVTARR